MAVLMVVDIRHLYLYPNVTFYISCVVPRHREGNQTPEQDNAMTRGPAVCKNMPGGNLRGNLLQAANGRARYAAGLHATGCENTAARTCGRQTIREGGEDPAGGEDPCSAVEAG